MNKKDIARILAILRANYPYAKFDNAEATTKAWEMSLGEYPAESVFNAARLHMKTSKFFPAPADIIEKMPRADLMFAPADDPKLLEGSQIKQIGAVHGQEQDEWTDERIKALLISIGFPED